MKPAPSTLIGADPSTIAGLTDAEGRTDVLPVFMLKVSAGPQTGAMFALDWSQSSRITIGYSEQADFSVSDPTISRRHVALAPEGALLRLTDVGSTNGTKVNGVRIVEALLRGGETIELGSSAIRVVRTGAQTESPRVARERFGRVLGRSAEMQRAFTLGEKLAASALPILIEGETGTGKELFAEAMHEVGPRQRGPFVVFAGATPKDTVERALHEAVLEAERGTLVIDEPQELAPAGQSLLLALLGRFEQQVRFIAITKKDLEREAEAGRLEQSLFARLAGARVELPPLRRRHGDIVLLGGHFWSLAGGTGDIPQELSARFHDYHWPGNVRELRYAVSRAVLVGGQQDLLQRGLRAPSPAHEGLIERLLAMNVSLPAARALLVQAFEERYVEHALAKHGGNVTRAAAASGLTRRYFHALRAKQK